MATEETTGTLSDKVKSAKEDPDQKIPVDVSFRIIKQFSTQLYDSPRRAIEELACNSYDAAAENCYIKTPDDENEPLKVLDDGESMDLDGLKWLWKIAESRKETELGDDRTQFGRQQIGKFGVGKLAAFALGNRLTHVATKDGITRVITVRQDRLRRDDAQLLDEDENPEIPRFGVYEFDEHGAQKVLEEYFDDIPNPWEEGWESWTLALVEEIPKRNTGDGLKPQYLHNMIRTSIPISSNFIAYLNGKKIDQRDPSTDLRFELNVTDESVTSRIESKLKETLVDYGEYDDVDDVPSEDFEVELTKVINPQNTSKSIQGIHVPNLGNVAGTGKFYEDSITSAKRADRGFSDHGFRVRVRGKLLNKDHEKFGLTNLSHRYWIKSLIEVEMPGLDDSIRVQRDDTMDTLEVKVAQTVLRAIFNAVRADGKKYEEDGDGGSDSTGGIKKPFSDRFTVRSRDYAYKALGGLTDSDNMPVDLGEVEIDFVPRGMSRDAVDYDTQSNTIRINEEHPLLESLERRDGFSDDLKDATSEILAGRLLLEGYQKYNDVDEHVVRVCRQIFESVLRSASDRFANPITYQMDYLRDASYQGNTEFEVAVAETFETMGLNAVQVGGPGASDGIITIPRAGDNLQISVEAKGSGDVVDHKAFGKGDTKRHMNDDKCDHVLIIAREFQLNGREDKKSAFVRSLEDYESLMDLKSIERLLRLQQAGGFSHPMLERIFTHSKEIEDLPGYISNVWEDIPEESPARRVLDEAHGFMAENETIPNIGIIQSQIPNMEYAEIKETLENIRLLAPGMIQYENESETQFQLKASPDMIMERLSSPSRNAAEVEFIND